MQIFFYHSYICWTWDLEFHSGGGRGFGFGSFHLAWLKKKYRHGLMNSKSGSIED
jgi:hypothetical protein